MLFRMCVSYENFAVYRERVIEDVVETIGRIGKKIEQQEMRIL